MDSSAVEERLLIDDEFYDELLAGEDELIDEYLAGELSVSARKSFDDYFMSTPERHEKLRFARGLRKYVSQVGAAHSQAEAINETEPRATPAPEKRGWFWFLPWQNPVLSYSLAAACVLILAVVTIAVIRNLAFRQPTGTVLAVELTSGLSRGDEQIKAFSVSNAETVELNLRIDPSDDYPSYRAVLQTIDGTEKLRDDGSQINSSGGAMVALRVPTRLLVPGTYYVKLSGRNKQGQYEDLGRYSFRITAD